MIQVNFEQVVNAHIPNIKIEEVGYIGRRVYVMLRMPDDVMHFYTCFEQKVLMEMLNKRILMKIG